MKGHTNDTSHPLNMSLGLAIGIDRCRDKDPPPADVLGNIKFVSGKSKAKAGARSIVGVH